MQAASSTETRARPHRPKALTVFTAAFVAGAVAAVGINRVLDVHLAQKKPHVESEPIFVALRSLPQGSPVTVWDVALRDWPKAMLPAAAMRAEDSFEGCVLRHPLREGQPLLSGLLIRGQGRAAPSDPPLFDTAFTLPAPAASVAKPLEADLWTPAPSDPVHPGPTVSHPEPQPPAAAALPSVGAPHSAASADVAPPMAVASSAVVTAVPKADEAGGDQDVHTEDQPLQTVADPLPVDTDAVLPTAERSLADSTSVTSVNEPTLADPIPGEPTPAVAAPTAETDIDSVVVAQSVTAPDGGDGRPPADRKPVDSAAADASQTATMASRPGDGVTRYLVVPERIALQVDSGFAARPPVPSTVQQQASRQTTATERSPSENPPSVSGTPPSQAKNRPASGNHGPVQPRSSQVPKPTVSPSRSQPRQQSRPQRQIQQRPQPAAATGWDAPSADSRGRGVMFPNIAAGIDALTGGTRRGRGADPAYEEAVATDDPAYRP